jgi:hypothetical protein
MRSTLRLISSAALSLVLSTAAWAQSKTFVYTANTLDNSISIYRFNSHTGDLVPSGGSPFNLNSLVGRFMEQESRWTNWTQWTTGQVVSDTLQ